MEYLIVGIASFSMLNKHSEVDTPVAIKDEPEPLSTKDRELQFSTLITVTEKIMRNMGILNLQ